MVGLVAGWRSSGHYDQQSALPVAIAIDLNNCPLRQFPGENANLRLPLWRVSLMIILFSTVFNMLTAHVGQTIIWILPAEWPLIGEPITLEAAVYGLINGLRLVTLLSFFLAFNTIVPVAQLASLVPAALHELGIVMLIAITYVPETFRQHRRITEAQAIRGHRLRGLRDWRPIVIPLLIAGLERSMNLAETMVARGYGHTGRADLPSRMRVLLVSGLFLALVGAILLAWGSAWAWIMIGIGVAAIGLAYFELGRNTRRTTYGPHAWTWADSALVASALTPIVLMIANPYGGVLTFMPYPRLHPPQFNLQVGIALFGLVFPAILYASTSDSAEAQG
jgi:energy-coupling factor transport system permease protein